MNPATVQGLPRLLIGPPPRRGMLLSVLKLADLSSMLVGFVAAVLLVALGSQPFTLERFLSLRLSVANFTIILLLLLLWHLGFATFRLYEGRRPVLAARSLLALCQAIGLNVLAVAACGTAFRMSIVTLPFLAVLWLASSATAVASRFLVSRSLRRLGRTDRRRRNVLIAGTGPRARRFARELEENPEDPGRVLGFVDEQWSGIEEFREAGHRVASDPKNLAWFLRENVVDEVIVALPSSAVPRGSPLFGACEEHGITVRLLSNVLDDLEIGALRREDFRDDIVLTVYNGSVEGWPQVAKRVLDVVLASVLLVVLSPLFALVGALIKWTSPGPVFFSQERVGYNKRRFWMIKFRSMGRGAEAQLKALEHLNEAQGPVFKIKDDPRITPIGRILRRTSIDELPQLLNVLKGEMSLVGPRPLPVRDVEGFERDHHRRRFSVRPGMTGLWQVSGRSSLPFERWMELDLRYVDEWSLGLDLRILLRTLPAVLRREGAV